MATLTGTLPNPMVPVRDNRNFPGTSSGTEFGGPPIPRSYGGAVVPSPATMTATRADGQPNQPYNQETYGRFVNAQKPYIQNEQRAKREAANAWYAKQQQMQGQTPGAVPIPGGYGQPAGPPAPTSGIPVPSGYGQPTAPQSGPPIPSGGGLRISFDNPDAFKGAPQVPTPQQDYDRAHPGQPIPTASSPSSPGNMAAWRAYRGTDGNNISPRDYAENVAPQFAKDDARYNTPGLQASAAAAQSSRQRADAAQARGNQSTADANNLNSQIANQVPYSGSQYRGDGSQASTVTGLPTPDQAAATRQTNGYRQSPSNSVPIPTAQTNGAVDNTPRTPAEEEAIRRQDAQGEFFANRGYENDPGYQKAHGDNLTALDAINRGVDPAQAVADANDPQGAAERKKAADAAAVRAGLTPAQATAADQSQAKIDTAKAQGDAKSKRDDAASETARNLAQAKIDEIHAKVAAGNATAKDLSDLHKSQAELNRANAAKAIATATNPKPGVADKPVVGESKFNKAWRDDNSADKTWSPPQNFANAGGQHWIQSPSGKFARNFFDDKRHFQDYMFDSQKDASGKEVGVWKNMATGTNFDDDKANMQPAAPPAPAPVAATPPPVAQPAPAPAPAATQPAATPAPTAATQPAATQPGTPPASTAPTATSPSTANPSAATPVTASDQAMKASPLTPQQISAGVKYDPLVGHPTPPVPGTKMDASHENIAKFFLIQAQLLHPGAPDHLLLESAHRAALAAGWTF